MHRNPNGLPLIEKFSRNPRFIRETNPIPVISLLGLNKNTNKTIKSSRIDQFSTKNSFAKNMKLPPLSNFPGMEKVDESTVKDLPGAPLTPSEVIQVFSDKLVPLEMSEILEFKEIWYIGEIEAKPFRASNDDDYNDRKKHYRALQNDEINYRYQVIEHAGGGAFSTVYKCIDHKLKIPVALKIIRAKANCMECAELEAEIQSQIQSSHSVRLIESFYWRGHFCISMELLYKDVYSIVEKNETMQLVPSVVRRITFQTTLCLRELAKKNIVHADIKPENILVNDEKLQRAKIADFGTACFADKQTFTYIQSRFYRAPEVLYGMRYGPPIDMWSLGCVVYELLIGRPIFPAQDEDELALMIESAIGPPPFEVYGNSEKYDYFQYRDNDENTYDYEYEYENEYENNEIKQYRSSSQPYTTHPVAQTEETIYEKHYQPSKPNEEPQPNELPYDRLDDLLLPLPHKIAKFIRECLVWDPQKRMTPDQALASEWLREEIEIIRKRKAIPPVIKEPKTARPPRPHWHYR